MGHSSAASTGHDQDRSTARHRLGRCDEPLVTVGLPVRNGSKFIAQAVESVLHQTYRNLELVISDNASSDNTGDIVQSYARRDSRVRYYRLDHDVGMAANFNRLVGLASGEYFKWICHDDYISTEFIAACITPLLETPRAITVIPSVAVVDAFGRGIRSLPDVVVPNYRPSSPSERHRAVISQCLREQRLGGTRRLFEGLEYGSP